MDVVEEIERSPQHDPQVGLGRVIIMSPIPVRHVVDAEGPRLDAGGSPSYCTFPHKILRIEISVTGTVRVQIEEWPWPATVYATCRICSSIEKYSSTRSVSHNPRAASSRMVFSACS